MKEGQEGIYKFGPFRVDAAERSLRRGQVSVPLTSKVFDLLLHLVRNPGRLVTKEELMGGIWPHAFVEENNLTVNMSALRKSLGEGGRASSHIETVPGRGYRFTTPVRMGEPQKGARENKWKSGAGISLAVLPLANMTEDSAHDYLSGGIMESIVNNLSQLPQLKVKAWNSVRRFTHREVDAQTVGLKLGVHAVLVGRMCRAGDRLHVAVELVDAADGTQVWGTEYEYIQAEILSLQEDIVGRVVESLRLRLTRVELRGLHKRHTASIKAYQFYQQGRHSLNNRTECGFREALGFFERALREDENYAPAHAGVADCYLLLGGYGVMSPLESMPLIKAALSLALERDKNLAEAHASLGHLKSIHEWDRAGADREFELAIKLNPSYATARHWYGLSLRARGLFDRALEELKLAQELDPLSPMIDIAIGSNAYYERRYDAAISLLRGTQELHPNIHLASIHLGFSYLELGAFEDAIKELSRLVGAIENPEALGGLGYAFGVAGRVKDARGILRELKSLAATRYVDPFIVGMVHTGLGEKDQAFEQFGKAVNHRSISASMFRVFPVLDSLRADPRFAELLLRVGL
jgi:DNA-binding winged helix-turn-helix (wHTH) protein/tetratricopeptide (TPR) repeat protein